MAQRKKLTKNQLEFKKQQARIKRFIKRAEKRGYEFSKNVVPQMPKRVTQKALKTITNIKPNDLYKQAEYVDRSTGEYLTGIEGRKIERAIATQKAKATREQKKNNTEPTVDPYFNVDDYPSDYVHSASDEVIVKQIYDELRSFPINLTSPLIQLVKNLVHENGVNAVATMWKALEEKFSECLARLHYDSKSAISDYSTQIIEHMPDMSDEYKKDLMEKFEYNEMGYTIDDED